MNFPRDCFLLVHAVYWPVSCCQVVSGRASYRPRSRGDNTFGSIHVCACVCVRLFVCVWTIWPLTLIFGMRVYLDLGLPGIVGQRSRSNSVCVCLCCPIWTSGAHRSILGLSLPSSANGNCEWPLPVTVWNCLFVSNQGAFNVSHVSGRSTLMLVIYRMNTVLHA